MKIIGCEIVNSDKCLVVLYDDETDQYFDYQELGIDDAVDLSDENSMVIVTSAPDLARWGRELVETMNDASKKAKYVDPTELVVKTYGFADKEAMTFIYVGTMEVFSKNVAVSSVKQDIQEDYLSEGDNAFLVFEDKHEYDYCILHDRLRRDFDENATITHGKLLDRMDLANCCIEYANVAQNELSDDKEIEIMGACKYNIIYNKGGEIHLFDYLGIDNELDFRADDIVKLVSSTDHIVLLLGNGLVKAYGDESYHQTAVDAWSDVKDICCGKGYTCAVRDSGDVVFCGSFGDFACCSVTENSNVERIFGSNDYVAVLCNDGKLFVYGGEFYGDDAVVSGAQIKDVLFLQDSIIVVYSDGSKEYFGEDFDGLAKQICTWNDVENIYIGDDFAVAYEGNGFITVGCSIDFDDIENFKGFVSADGGVGVISGNQLVLKSEIMSSSELFKRFNERESND